MLEHELNKLGVIGIEVSVQTAGQFSMEESIHFILRLRDRKIKTDTQLSLSL